MKRLLFVLAVLLLSADAADASHRRPVRRVLGAVVRPLAGPREVFRERSTVRVFGAPAASSCGPNGCPIPGR
jgi:hypothetical protein